MKRAGIAVLVFSFILTMLFQSMPVLAVEPSQGNTVVNGAHSVDAQIPVAGSEQLVSNVESAIVYEANTQTLMHAWNADKRVSPASLVKILTALIVADQVNPADNVQVKESVLNTIPYDAATADLVPDEILTVEQLLYCMMVGSANDAAAVLADYASGSQEDFVAEMNRYAAELGCTGTHFTNVHGLHDDDQYTTARDVVRILSEAVKNELFRTVFETVYYTVPATNKSEARDLASGNFLVNSDSVEIYYDTRVTGGRTGVTSTGHRCIAVTAEYNGMYMISVVTGSESEYEEDGYRVKVYGGYQETSDLLTACFSENKASQIVYTGQAMAQYSVENGNADVIVASTESVYAVLPENVTVDDLTFRYMNVGDGFNAPIEKGQNLINMEIWYRNTCIAQVDLVAMNAVPLEEPYLDINRREPDKANWKLILVIILCVLIAAAVALILIRSARRVRLAAARRRSRRYRMSRRRSR